MLPLQCEAAEVVLLQDQAMRNIAALTLLMLSSTSIASSTIQELHLYLSITEGEHSRDSNATTTTISINGTHLVYDQSYSGYRASSRKPIHKEISIKDEDVEKLWEFISSKGLLNAGSARYATSDYGRYVIITLNVLSAKKKPPVKISGMTRVLGAETLYQDVQALREEMDRIIDAAQ
jgi:hypothetical protein